MKSEKIGIERDCFKSLEPFDAVEMCEITRIADIENHLVEDNQYRNLHQNREARSERIDAFSFVEFHHFHTYLCLIALEFFLYGLYFWLYDLHTALRYEHFLLRNQENQTNNKCNSDDSPAQTVPRKYEHETSKEIVDRIIEKSAKKETNITRMTDAQRDFREILRSCLCIGKLERDAWYFFKT